MLKAVQQIEAQEAQWADDFMELGGFVPRNEGHTGRQQTIQSCQLELHLHQATAVESVEVEDLSPKAWQLLCFCHFVQASSHLDSNVAPDTNRRRRQLMPGHNLLMRCNMG